MNQFMCMLNPDHPECKGQGGFNLSYNLEGKKPTAPYWDNYQKQYGNIPETGQQLSGVQAYAMMPPAERNAYLAQASIDPTNTDWAMQGQMADAGQRLVDNADYTVTSERMGDLRANQGLPGFNLGSIMKGMKMMSPQETKREPPPILNPQARPANIQQEVCGPFDIECQRRNGLMPNRGLF